jgi:hypothetical protein
MKREQTPGEHVSACDSENILKNKISLPNWITNLFASSMLSV